MLNNQMSPKTESRFAELLPYFAFIFICFLCAIRDVFSEWFMKNSQESVSPYFTLFIFSAVTVLSCFIYLVFSRNGLRVLNKQVFSQWEHFKNALLVSVYTFLAFLCYFLAISTPLGAGLNSFIDYGTFPLFTAALAVFFLNEKIEKKFYIAALLCISGIALFMWPRIQLNTSVSAVLFIGLFYSLMGAFFSGFFSIYSKRLLNYGLDIIALVFIRLFFSTCALGLFILVKGEQHSFFVVLSLSVLGFFGATLLLILSTFALKKMKIKSFALVSYSIPILTYLFSWSFGHTTLFWIDIFASTLILSALFYYEYKKQ